MNQHETYMREALEETEKDVSWVAGGDEVSQYEDILAYLSKQLSGSDAADSSAPLGFGSSLTAQQARQFQQIREEMKAATKALGKQRAYSAPAIRREIAKIIDRRDKDVREIVSEEQWALYDNFKQGLVQELEGELDIVRLQ